MTSERYKWGDEITLYDRTPEGGVTYNMTALNVRVANAAYAQALADVDAAAEKLGETHASVEVSFEGDDVDINTGYWAYTPIAKAPTLTQAILSTGGE